MCARILLHLNYNAADHIIQANGAAATTNHSKRRRPVHNRMRIKQAKGIFNFIGCELASCLVVHTLYYYYFFV